MSRSKQPLTIEHAILGFLWERAIHGYEVHQRLSSLEGLGLIWPLKQGHFYALVSRLEEEGYLSVTVEQRGTLPPRKLLELTDRGRAAFTTWLQMAPAPDVERQREFLARFYFARQLGPATLGRLLLHERHELEVRLQSLRDTGRVQTPHSYPWLVNQWQLGQAEAALDWLDTFGPPPACEATYSIAALADSPVAELAERFVHYVRGPSGQVILARSGFLTTAAPVDPQAARSKPLRGRLVVYAAASLTTAFEALTAAFSAEHPRVRVHCIFGGSHHLAARLVAGAHCDVFAPAHQEAMEPVIAAGRVAAAAVATLAHNQLAIVTPARGRIKIKALGDLARPGLRLAFGSEATAIGRYTQDLLAAATFDGSLTMEGPAAVLHNVVFYGETVSSVLAAVERGEVDAGVVFTSDYHRAAGAVQLAAVPLH